MSSRPSPSNLWAPVIAAGALWLHAQVATAAVPRGAAPQLPHPEGFGGPWATAQAGLSWLEQLHGLWAAFGFDAGVHTGGPRLGAIAFLALAATVVIALGRLRLVTEQKRLELARQLVEQGFEPPPTLLAAPARADRRRGVVLVFAALGLSAAGWVLGDRGLTAGGLVPGFIGLGYLVSYRLAARGDVRP